MSLAPPAQGVVAVLTAAGSGRRLGAGGPKALVRVGGLSLLRRAAQGLVDSGVVDHVVVTAPAAELDRFRVEVDAVAAEAVEVVAGSPVSRQASVRLGLEAALDRMPGAEVVLVHDAARALTPPEVTRRVVAAVRAGHGAVVPALAVADTVKEVAPGLVAAQPGPAYLSAVPDRPGCLESGGEEPPGPWAEAVVGTPERARLRAVQTPQGFSAGVLVSAHRAGAAREVDEALAASDDAGLVEAQGGRVVVVAGHEQAFKITTPLDLALAEAVLRDEDSRTRPPSSGEQ
ncbi:2-C-methyl-D-erythritol 4-phosphate cytidylyltransferase [Actinomyces lilanjuaniae]|uniref:2-C-methyl-D-erythritol 4-phosphate cytidylyltransferase n=1 Tax=Actinomyces lilanjuaniae TaxID=2321394 RepID=A0ABM6Z5P4_9ACTO|nr:IspD/TarI family cytidylyltransferase [Actinomyces lilanjuaniae]AYD90532.1 2-C-methyl-D-erythritol 4-phosphate cytidylyltransferase [Actinomyces lilanjuaniae]